MFITFEGGDAGGKTTQIGLLADYLIAQGVRHVVTREPGGTPLGERIRSLLLDSGPGAIEPLAEALLFAGSRAQLILEVIRPALEEGKVVLCDRFTDSTLAYQGYGLGMDLGLLREVNLLATAGLVPDLTFLFDLDPEEADRRGRSRGEGFDRISGRGREFSARVRRGYLDLAREEPGRFVVLRAGLETHVLARLIREGVSRRLQDGGAKGGYDS